MKKINNVVFASITVMIVVWISILFFTEKAEEEQMISEWIRPKTLSSIAWEYEETVENYIVNKEVVIEQSSTFKSYMPYTSVKDVSSTQYRVRQLAYTSEFGLRKVNDRFCVAVGTAITSKSGTYIDVILENGTVIPCVVGDIKADVDTNSDNITTSDNNCVSEFLVDVDALSQYIKKLGDVSHCYEEWMSPVEKIIVYERSVFDE